MIAHSEIHLREDFCTGKLIEESIYSRKRVFVLDCVEVDRTVVNDKTTCLVLLFHQDSGASPRRRTGLDVAFAFQLLKL